MMDKKVYSERLPNRSSTFFAELHALFLALDHVATGCSQSVIIFSESNSVVESLRSKDLKNPLFLKILERGTTIYVLSVIGSLFIFGYIVILLYKGMNVLIKLQKMAWIRELLTYLSPLQTERGIHVVPSF